MSVETQPVAISPLDAPAATKASVADAPLRTTGYLLSTAGRLVRERFERALEPHGLRGRHFGVLTLLADAGPLPQGVAAHRLALDKSTMVAVIDDLETLGLVERRRNRVDRRAYELIPTAAGREKLAAIHAALPGFGADWFAPLDQSERQHLHDLLTRLLFAPGGWLASPDTPARPDAPVSDTARSLA